MRHSNKTHRFTILALSASLVLPIAPVFGQAQPVVVAPPSPVSAAPPPAAAAPPPVSVTPQPTAPSSPVARAMPAETASAPRATRAAPRTARAAPAQRPRVATPQASPAPAAATPPPLTNPVADTPPPIEAAPLPPPTATATTISGSGIVTRGPPLLWLLAGLALLAALAAFALSRRRRETVYEEVHEERPVHAAAPALAPAEEYQTQIVVPLPSFRREQPAVVAQAEETLIQSDLEEVSEVETSAADVAVLAADAPAHGDRPWLELLMRPIRAGANGDDTVVEFSLTVGNTGGIPAENVRISAWMLGTQGSEAEGLLIEPPAGSTLAETRIEAGDGATVEATVSMPREAFDRAVLPIVVTDARYPLPGGGEGRTSACFAVGLPIGEELVPFPANAASGLNEGVEARVHCEVEHV